MPNTRTLLDLQNLTLKLINSYSSDGVPLVIADNADILQLVNDYLNIAYYEFAHLDKIMVSKDYTTADETIRPDGVTKQYTLPTDYLDFCRLEYNTLDQEITDFDIRGNLLFAKTTTDPLTFWYYKLPDRLSLATDIPLIRPQYHDYLSFYAAGTWLRQNGRAADGIDIMVLYDDSKAAVIPVRQKGINKIRNVMGY